MVEDDKFPRMEIEFNFPNGTEASAPIGHSVELVVEQKILAYVRSHSSPARYLWLSPMLYESVRQHRSRDARCYVPGITELLGLEVYQHPNLNHGELVMSHCKPDDVQQESGHIHADEELD